MWPFKKDKEDKRLFHNEAPLHLPTFSWEELPKLDLGAFLIVEDFTIKITQTGRFGLHLYFYSPTLGRLASFPWWDNVENDLPSYTSKNIPVGDLEEPIEPFDDLEQGWQIIIFEHEGYVYVMEGQDPCCTEYPIWFRVARESHQAIQPNSIIPINSSRTKRCTRPPTVRSFLAPFRRRVSLVVVLQRTVWSRAIK